ncbi:MAG: hypothetical protein KTR25_19430 [Myxococcales bacterium]|nr:hypothetical protein [Myxococcales bacterium]
MKHSDRGLFSWVAAPSMRSLRLGVSQKAYLELTFTWTNQLATRACLTLRLRR